MTVTEGRLRIGELARRTGASPAVLRAWEQRYGIIEPQRSPGGTRLYSERDEERIHTMQAHMADGLSAAQAARAALAGRAPRGSRSLATAANGPAASQPPRTSPTQNSEEPYLGRTVHPVVGGRDVVRDLT